MKRTIIFILAAFCALAAFSQAKKPTLMVVPSDAWCISNGYVTVYDNQGTETKIPDYKAAFQSDMDLALAISKINSIMAGRGYPLKNLESVMRSIEQRTAENNLTVSKTSGAQLAESPIDVLRRTAKADIVLNLSWKVNHVGPKKSMTIILQGIDAYTNMQIAGCEGTGKPSSSSEIPILLEEALVDRMENFTDALDAYFINMEEMGREVAVDIQVFDNGSGLDLESEFNGYELSEIIDEWMYQNTMGHRYSKLDGSENYIYYEQVRIPLFDAQGRAVDTESFVRELRRYLRSNYQVESKILMRGLGRAVLVLGEK